MRRPIYRPNLGVGKRAGRRPKQYRVEKADLEPLLRELYAFGFGSRTIGSLLGYSHAQIYIYATEFGIRNPTGAERAEAIIELLPTALRSAIQKIRTRSRIAHRRKVAPERVRIHLLVDDPD